MKQDGFLLHKVSPLMLEVMDIKPGLLFRLKYSIGAQEKPQYSRRDDRLLRQLTTSALFIGLPR